MPQITPARVACPTLAPRQEAAGVRSSFAAAPTNQSLEPSRTLALTESHLALCHAQRKLAARVSHVALAPRRSARSQHVARSSRVSRAPWTSHLARTNVAHDNQMATQRDHHRDHEITKRSHLAHNLDLARTPESMRTQKNSQLRGISGMNPPSLPSMSSRLRLAVRLIKLVSLRN
jgi:hypothetical protein